MQTDLADEVVDRWDDGIILPRDTRNVLGLGLSVAMKSFKPDREGKGNFGVFRM